MSYERKCPAASPVLPVTRSGKSPQVESGDIRTPRLPAAVGVGRDPLRHLGLGKLVPEAAHAPMERRLGDVVLRLLECDGRDLGVARVLAVVEPVDRGLALVDFSPPAPLTSVIAQPFLRVRLMPM